MKKRRNAITITDGAFKQEGIVNDCEWGGGDTAVRGGGANYD